MNVISREIVSDNFVGINLPEGDAYNKQQLCGKIDQWKYFLTKQCGAKNGNKILVGVSRISVDFLALCFACFELSLAIVIADEDPERIVGGNRIVNPKIASLMPFDILIWDDINLNLLPVTNKFHYYRKNCKAFCTIGDFRKFEYPENLDDVSNIRPSETDVLMITTSSGSTGTAKNIQHKHNFFYELCIRNSSQFQGNVVHIRNMHHGSSLSVFYLPSLVCDNVDAHYFFGCDRRNVDLFVKHSRSIDLNHLSLPYIRFAEDFLAVLKKQNVKFPNLRLSLLTYIPTECKEFIKQGYIKEVESIFGSNETAGPVFLSTLNLDNIDDYNSSQFYKLDDFYGIELNNNNLEVTLPVYDTTICTEDVFEMNGIFYTHKGRSNLIRINDVEINLNRIEDICKKYNNNVVLITDDIENKMYLLIQKNSLFDNPNSISEITQYVNDSLRLISDRLRVDKYLVEDFIKFISGIKLDKELIREYFRTYV